MVEKIYEIADGEIKHKHPEKPRVRRIIMAAESLFGIQWRTIVEQL